MFQTAVFVDAGYLFAQGSVLIAGARLPRDKVALDARAAAAALADAARTLAPEARLLRIYWYDGLIRGGARTAEQTVLGRSADLKLRLGMVNSRGEQKGVDSLIVTDMIELARNGAISDAVVLSGDEDIRVGVQVAQTYGVRAHLIGVKPALGSQSPDLVEESDTHTEWDASVVSSFLSVKVVAPPPGTSAGGIVDGTFDAVAPRLAVQLVDELGAQREQLKAYVDANRGALPAEVDRPALARLRDELGRDLTDDERKRFRQLLRVEARRG